MPVEDIVRRFYRSKHNFWHIYKDRVDQWHLYYNSGEQAQEVAVGAAGRATVINENLFELFMQDISNGGTQ